MFSWFIPLPRSVTRPISILVLVAWAGVMASVINRSYLQASANLATDLARYGSTAQWRGVYYRGEKLGFSVSQTVPIDNDDPAKAGFELQEDARSTGERSPFPSPAPARPVRKHGNLPSRQCSR